MGCEPIVKLLFSVAEPAQMGIADDIRDYHSNGSALLFSHPPLFLQLRTICIEHLRRLNKRTVQRLSY